MFGMRFNKVSHRLSPEAARRQAAGPRWLPEKGATFVGYMLVTGLVGIAGLWAVLQFNGSSEYAIQNGTQRSSTLVASNAGAGTSLAAETSKEVGIDTAAGMATGAVVAPAIIAAGIIGHKRSKKEENAQDLPGDKSNCKPGEDCTAPSGTCFVAGTLVLTPTGLRPIEDIKVGDYVMAPAEPPFPYDPEFDEPEDSDDVESLGDASAAPNAGAAVDGGAPANSGSAPDAGAPAQPDAAANQVPEKEHQKIAENAPR